MRQREIYNKTEEDKINTLL